MLQNFKIYFYIALALSQGKDYNWISWTAMIIFFFILFFDIYISQETNINVNRRLKHLEEGQIKLLGIIEALSIKVNHINNEI